MKTAHKARGIGICYQPPIVKNLWFKPLILLELEGQKQCIWEKTKKLLSLHP